MQTAAICQPKRAAFWISCLGRMASPRPYVTFLHPEGAIGQAGTIIPEGRNNRWQRVDIRCHRRPPFQPKRLGSAMAFTNKLSVDFDYLARVHDVLWVNRALKRRHQRISIAMLFQHVFLFASANTMFSGDRPAARQGNAINVRRK